jgi:hypothetical protein
VRGAVEPFFVDREKLAAPDCPVSPVARPVPRGAERRAFERVLGHAREDVRVVGPTSYNSSRLSIVRRNAPNDCAVSRSPTCWLRKTSPPLAAATAFFMCAPAATTGARV